MEMRGNGTVGDANQFNDNPSATDRGGLNILGNDNVLLSYMWLKSDRWGTVNWGQLSQATDNVALLPDLSGTIIEFERGDVRRSKFLYPAERCQEF